MCSFTHNKISCECKMDHYYCSHYASYAILRIQQHRMSVNIVSTPDGSTWSTSSLISSTQPSLLPKTLEVNYCVILRHSNPTTFPKKYLMMRLIIDRQKCEGKKFWWIFHATVRLQFNFLFCKNGLFAVLFLAAPVEETIAQKINQFST